MRNKINLLLSLFTTITIFSSSSFASADLLTVCKSDPSYDELCVELLANENSKANPTQHNNNRVNRKVTLQSRQQATKVTSATNANKVASNEKQVSATEGDMQFRRGFVLLQTEDDSKRLANAD